MKEKRLSVRLERKENEQIKMFGETFIQAFGQVFGELQTIKFSNSLKLCTDYGDPKEETVEVVDLIVRLPEHYGKSELLGVERVVDNYVHSTGTGEQTFDIYSSEPDSPYQCLLEEHPSYNLNIANL